ncbi:MAG: hypothetical protein IPM46_02185 [Flavobacteriales bacterium]|nr:hypothetical protein [Flavobacteriales bacterium]
MRAKSLVVLVLVALFLLCSFHRDAALAFDDQRTADADVDLLEFDLVQRTCALEVVLAVRDPDALHAIEPSLEPTPIHWDAQPGSSTLACLPAPAK